MLTFHDDLQLQLIVPSFKRQSYAQPNKLTFRYTKSHTQHHFYHPQTARRTSERYKDIIYVELLMSEAFKWISIVTVTRLCRLLALSVIDGCVCLLQATDPFNKCITFLKC